MGRTPTLPPGTPTALSGWTYDPDPYNGNAWFGPDRETTVFVYPIACAEETALWVKDERLSGWNHVELLRSSYEHTVEMAVEWMERHSPADWSHPRVCEAAFGSPRGWSLERYSIGARKDTITYVRESPPETCQKQVLQIQGYQSTGNWEFGIVDVPSRRAGHIKDQLDEDVPSGSSLEIALAMAFDRAVDVVDDDPSERQPTGQTTFDTYTA